MDENIEYYYDRLQENILIVEENEEDAIALDAVTVNFKAVYEYIKMFLISNKERYYGYFLMDMEMRIDYFFDHDAGVNMDTMPFTLTINPLLLGKHTIKEMIFIVCHEIEHIVLEHPAEAKKVNITSDPWESVALNYAMDASVNDRLIMEINKYKLSIMSSTNADVTSDFLSDEYGVTLEKLRDYLYYYDKIATFETQVIEDEEFSDEKKDNQMPQPDEEDGQEDGGSQEFDDAESGNGDEDEECEDGGGNSSDESSNESGDGDTDEDADSGLNGAGDSEDDSEENESDGAGTGESDSETDSNGDPSDTDSESGLGKDPADDGSSGGEDISDEESEGQSNGSGYKCKNGKGTGKGGNSAVITDNDGAEDDDSDDSTPGTSENDTLSLEEWYKKLNDGSQDPVDAMGKEDENFWDEADEIIGEEKKAKKNKSKGKKQRNEKNKVVIVLALPNNGRIITAKNRPPELSLHKWTNMDVPEEIREQLRQYIQQVVDGIPDDCRGLFPSHQIEALNKALEKPKIKWEQVLRKYIGTIPNGYRKTRTRLDRRQPERFDISGKISKRTIDIVVAIDTSESMSSQLLEKIFTEIFTILKSKEFKLTIIECDAEIQNVYEAKTMQDVKLEVHGRGGTSFIPVIKYVNENKKYRKSFLIYFTDGMGDDSIPKPQVYRMLWVLPYAEATGGVQRFLKEDERYLSVKEPYGDVISMDVDPWILRG